MLGELCERKDILTPLRYCHFQALPAVRVRANELLLKLITVLFFAEDQREPGSQASESSLFCPTVREGATFT